MGQHIVMVVGGYYPNPSPTGKCAEQYISLIHKEHEVDVVCIGRKSRVQEEYAGKRIRQVASPYVIFQDKLKENMELLYQISKLPIRFLNLFRHPNNLHWYLKYAYQKLKEIQSQNPINVIFSVGAPIAAHCSVAKFKKEFPNVRWITYSVDSYAAQNGNKKKFINFERDVLSQADHNFLSDEIYKNSPFLYDGFSEKVTSLPYLLPKMPDVEKTEIFERGKIHCVYAGSFYQKIRNPKFLLDIFMLMERNIILHLYCTSDCNELIDAAVSSSNGRIIRHKPVGPDEIFQIYEAADILVNVGNSLPEFKPSKTFEYIATGKPILDIHYDGLRDSVLEKYPFVFQVANSTNPKDVEKYILAFLLTNAGKRVDINVIHEIYSKYTESNIRSILLEHFMSE